MTDFGRYRVLPRETQVVVIGCEAQFGIEEVEIREAFFAPA